MSQLTPSTPLDLPSGSLATEVPPEERVYFGLTLATWVKIALVAGLMAAIFWPNLRRLWLKTNPIWGEPNWGHSMIIPIIGIYYLYINREELLRATVKTAWTGLPVLVGGLLLAVYGIYPGQNDYVKDFGMVITLFGVVLLLGGWQVMKVAWFPILFLVAAIPWPGLVYSWVAGPLQQLAAKVAVVTLQITGVHAFYSGTKIIITVIEGGVPKPRTLNVAEACAGLRSLMTFITVGAAVAFLSARPLWQKLIITASAVPIAIFCNVMRVSGQGLLDYYVSQEWSQSFAHQFAGMVMLIPAFFLILLVAWVLDHIFIEEVEHKHEAAAAKAGKDLVIEVPKRPQPAVAVESAPTSAAAPVKRQEPPQQAAPPPKMVIPPRPRLAPGRPAPRKPTGGT